MESWRKRDTVTQTQSLTHRQIQRQGGLIGERGGDSPTRIRMTEMDRESRWIDREERKGIVEVRLTEPTCASVSHCISGRDQGPEQDARRHEWERLVMCFMTDGD